MYVLIERRVSDEYLQLTRFISCDVNFCLVHALCSVPGSLAYSAHFCLYHL